MRVDEYMSAIIAIYELQDVRPLIDLYVYSYMRTCAAYDSTVQAMGFDAVRVRYRQQRRKIIQGIILDNKVGTKLQQYIQKETTKQIPQADQKAFIEDIQEDLDQMDESRLAGLGIDFDQMRKWLQSWNAHR